MKDITCPGAPAGAPGSRVARLRRLLPSPMDAESARLVREVLAQRARIEDVCAYLEVRSRLSHQTFEAWLAFCQALQATPTREWADRRAPAPTEPASTAGHVVPSFDEVMAGVARGVPPTIARAFGSVVEVMLAVSRDARDCPGCGCPGTDLAWGFWERDSGVCAFSGFTSYLSGWASACLKCRRVVEVRHVHPPSANARRERRASRSRVN